MTLTRSFYASNFADNTLRSCEKDSPYKGFSKVHKRIIAHRLSKIFSYLKDQLKAQLWEERDKARKEKYDKLYNKILPKLVWF